MVVPASYSGYLRLVLAAHGLLKSPFLTSLEPSELHFFLTGAPVRVSSRAERLGDIPVCQEALFLLRFLVGPRRGKETALAVLGTDPGPLCPPLPASISAKRNLVKKITHP